MTRGINKIIQWLECEIETQQETKEKYMDFLDCFQCPACDCSECFSDCGKESLTDSIDHSEMLIDEYTDILKEIETKSDLSVWVNCDGVATRYESIEDMESEYNSHCVGFPLSLIKYVTLDGDNELTIEL